MFGGTLFSGFGEGEGGGGGFAEKLGENELRISRRYEAGSCAHRCERSLWTGGDD